MYKLVRREAKKRWKAKYKAYGNLYVQFGIMGKLACISFAKITKGKEETLGM